MMREVEMKAERKRLSDCIMLLCRKEPSGFIVQCFLEENGVAVSLSCPLRAESQSIVDSEITR